MPEQQHLNHDERRVFDPAGLDAPFRPDLQLMNQVKKALLDETESAGIDVHVSAEGGGVVRLHGVVDVLSHARAAEEIARRVPGVTGVENNITVANEENASDKDIREAVTTKLSGHDELMSIGCDVHKGVAILVGHAGSKDDVRTAVAMVEDMAGVREVKIGRVKIGEGEKEDDADVARQADRVLEQLGFDHNLFQVYCDAGVLFVKGFVPTQQDRSRLKKAMRRIPGVDKLEALLVTEDQYGGEVH